MEHPSELSGPPGHLECKGRVLLGIGDLLAQLPKVPPELIEFVRKVGQDLIERGRLFAIDGDRS
jgi:hypothetical protein